MPEPAELRIGRAERERAVELLKSAYAEGRLDREELEERVEGAMTARTESHLRPLLGDLPQSAAGDALRTEPQPAPRHTPAADRVRAVLGTVLGCVFCRARSRHPRRTPSSAAGRRTDREASGA